MNNKKTPKNIDEKLKNREIKRLTTPLKYPRFIIGNVYDIEGGRVQPTISIWPASFKYILEPKIKVLTDNEILEYAPESKTASKVRLKRGIDTFSDKTILYGNKILAIWIFIGFGGSLIFGSLAFIIGLFFGRGIISASATLLFTLGIPTIYTLYIFYLKNYTKVKDEKQVNFIKKDNSESKSINIRDSKDMTSTNSTNSINSMKSFKDYKKQIYQVEKLYKTKEKIARELIEKRFTPPQLTYDRFIGVIDSCNSLFHNQVESAMNLMDMATDHTLKIDDELKKRLNTLKSIVAKIDELTNELAINLTDSDQSYSEETKDLLKNMQELVDSVKEYD